MATIEKVDTLEVVNDDKVFMYELQYTNWIQYFIFENTSLLFVFFFWQKIKYLLGSVLYFGGKVYNLFCH